MAKFKVGDRVRGTADEDGKGKGCIGVVVELNHYIVVDFDPPFDGWGDSRRWWGLPESKLEHAPKFAVGDKVRVLIDDMCNSYKKGAIVNLEDVDSEGVSFIDEDGDLRYLGFADVEPVSAPLTITAGRYYKTRDGRKVGPMERDCSFREPAFIEIVGDGCGWSKSGNALGDEQDGDEDLIAEWVDEPVAAEPKFKVGDTVVATEDDCAITKGKAYIINAVEFDETDPMPFRVIDDEGDNYWLTKGCFESHTPRPAIVALIENGQPKPATRPYVHADRGAAAKEARRLAGVHRGQEFGVYEFVDSAKEARVYEHEWQRLAVSGQKIAAIKEVRAATGFTLKGAKDAVEHWLVVEAA